MMTPPHPAPSTCAIDEALARSIAEARRAALARTYFWQGELLAMPGLLPRTLVDALVEDVHRVRAAAVRRQLPGYKGSSSVAWPVLRAGAPSVAGLFHSAAFRGLVEEVADASLVAAPGWDPHACAVYHYDREGDGIGYHYDTSWYRGARYTVLVGLVNRSTALLSCDLHTREPQRPRRTLEIATEPGTVVVFHGDKVWHRVTPLGPGEERTVLTLQYVTDPRMSALGRAVSFAKDAFAYFGVRQAARALFTRPEPHALPAGVPPQGAATP
jgi:alkylated DNA repair dioxygenase AlkB